MVKNLIGEEVLDWIFEHDLLTEDFCRHFGIENLEESILLNMTEVKNYVLEL